MQHRRAVVWLSTILAIVCVIAAFYTYGQKIDQLNKATKSVTFLTGRKAAATCASARQSRELWKKMSDVVIARVPPSDQVAYAKAQDLIAAVNKYVSTNPSCDLKQGR